MTRSFSCPLELYAYTLKATEHLTLQVDPKFGTPGDAVWATSLIDANLFKEMDLRDTPEGMLLYIR